jgi:hypothetical protein
MRRQCIVGIFGGVLLLIGASAAHAIFPPQDWHAASPSSGAGLTADGVDRKAGLPRYEDGEILIKYKAHPTNRFSSPDEQKCRKDLHRKHGSESIREFPPYRVEHVRLKKGIGVEDAIRLYQQDPMVEYAEPNVTVERTTHKNPSSSCG